MERVTHPTSVGVTKDTMDKTVLLITVAVTCSTAHKYVQRMEHAQHQVPVPVNQVITVSTASYTIV